MSATHRSPPFRVLVALACAGALVPAAALAASPDKVAAVNVEFAKVDGGNRDRDLQYTPAERGYRKRLAGFVAAGASPLLAEGQRLMVIFNEVTLAGSYEPWRAPRADSVRFVTAAYPPRIALEFRWFAADGSVIRAGDRLLTNLDYQRDPRAALSNDPLRYEKALIDAWLERELAPL